MVASLRFSGQLFETMKLSLLVSKDLKGDCEEPETSRCTLWRFSELLGLVAPSALFSCPDDSMTEGVGTIGSELPLSGAVLSALFKGLFGDARARVKGLEGDVFAALADRSDSLTLGRKGVNMAWCATAPLA